MIRGILILCCFLNLGTSSRALEIEYSVNQGFNLLALYGSTSESPSAILTRLPKLNSCVYTLRTTWEAICPQDQQPASNAVTRTEPLSYAEGVWASFSTAQSFSITATILSTFAVPLQPGWQIRGIGSTDISTPANLNQSSRILVGYSQPGQLPQTYSARMMPPSTTASHNKISSLLSSYVVTQAYYIYSSSASTYFVTFPPGLLPSDTTSPTITQITPANQSTNVSVVTSIELVFSESMDVTSLSTANVVLSVVSGSAVSVTLQSTGTHETLRVVPSQPLSNATNYQLNLSGLKDLAGNVMNAQAFGFATEAASGSVMSVSSCSQSVLSGVADLSLLNPRLTTTQGQNGFSLSWNRVTNATRYSFFVSGLQDFSDYQDTEMLWEYNAGVGGYSSLGTVFQSALANNGNQLTFTLRAYNSSSQLLTSEVISFTVGTPYPQTPDLIWGTALNQGVELQWCGLPNHTQYRVEQSIGGGNYTTVAASQAVTSLSAASLTNGTAYSYRVLASLDGTVFGLPSRPVTITPSANPVENVSIAKLSLNQGVEKFIAGQTDSISVPAIQDRTGYLRLYLQAQNPHSQAQKLLVKLYSQRNSQTLTRIEQEVLFRSSDADNEVLNQINIELPEWINKAGTEFYIELGNSRLPSTGTTSFGFVAVPKMQVRLFPLNANGVSIPENEWETYRLELQKYLTAMFPSVGVEVQLAPVPQEYANLVINTVDSWNTELSSFDQLRDTEIEGKPALASVFYYGMFRPTEVDQGGGLAGLANTNIGYPTSNNPPSLSGIGIAYDIKTFVETAAHEIGHNLGRIHVNGVGDGCQFPGPTDESYPHANGVIGKTGLNLLTRQLLASNYYFDIMSYCSRVWISDYNYKAMYDFLTALYQNNNVTASVAKIPPTPGYFMRGLLYADYAEVTGVFAGKGYEFSGNSGLKLRVLNDRQELLEYAVQTIEVDHSDARSWKAFIPESSGLVKAFLYSEEQDRVLWEAEESGLSSNVLASSSLVSPVIRVAEDRYAYYNQEEQNTLLRLSRDGGLTYEVIAMGKIRQTEFNAKAGDLFEVQTSQGLWPQVFQYVLP